MRVEIWSDIACPWCYIGKRRFEAALARFDRRDDVEVVWRSFELDPEAPAEPEGDLAEALARKYGSSVEQVHQRWESMTAMAAEDGLDMRFRDVRRGNTFDAHRLTHLAAAHGLGDATVERLFRAHHTEGRLLSDHMVLERLAAEAGLPGPEVAEALASDRFAAEVREDEATARGLGISAVPFFVIDRRFGLAGAQPPEVIGEGLRRAWEAQAPLSVVAEGDVCGPDGC
jgi:predicted DsbA family dithiol-disulfide isomerase